METASPPPDLALLLEAASDFASYPGLQSDASAKEFLHRFPLTVLFGVLRSNTDVPGLEDTIIACLDKLFRTRYGASLLLHYASFLQAGLQANSQNIRCLACKAVSYILQNTEDIGTSMKILIGYGIYSLLVSCLLDGDEQASAASMDAIKCIAQFSEGISVIFPASTEESSIKLDEVAAHSSSLARIRILALIKELFRLSTSVALAAYDANLLKLFEVEIYKGNDMLTTLSALEILYELVESPHSTRFLLKTTLLQQLINIISNDSVESILRSRAVLISGRLLSKADTYGAIDEASIAQLLVTIDRRLEHKGQDTEEQESALEALGQIGISNEGANLLLTSPTRVARHILESAFDHHGRGIQLAALHALGSICGANRPQDKMLLNNDAEECLRILFYVTAANTLKLTPSGLLLSVLQQEPEIRLAAYIVISSLVVRPWCLREVCMKQEIISVVTDANIEATKIGMDTRHFCCAAIANALTASRMLSDVTIAGVAKKLQEAVKRGPYLAKRNIEAQPVVMTAERF